LAHDIGRDAGAAVAHVEQRSRDAADVADANGDRAAELRLRFGAAMHDTPSGMPNSAASPTRRERSGRVTRRFVDDGIERVRDALDERKARVGSDIDETKVALCCAQRRQFIHVTPARSNGAARVLDGIGLEQLE
jgi:hypothetical protein